MLGLRLESVQGSNLKENIKEAKLLCKKLSLAHVIFKFNGVDITVGAFSDIENVVNTYTRRIFDE